MKTIAKWCAKIALNYLPDVAVWLIRLATSKTASDDKAKRAIEVVQMVALDAATLASIMEDGEVSNEEALTITSRASELSDKLMELL